MSKKDLLKTQPVKKDSKTRNMWRAIEIIPMGTGKYTPHQKYEAAMLYTGSGNLKKVEKLTKIPYDTLKHWTKTSWWPEVCSMCSEVLTSNFSGRLNSIVSKSLNCLEERLEQGDMVLTRDGSTYVPVKAKDLMNIAKQATETKAKTVENNPTKKDKEESTTKQFLDLGMALAMIAKNAQEGNYPRSEVSNDTDGEIVDGEILPNEPEKE